MSNLSIEKMAAKLQKQAAKESPHSNQTITRIINVAKNSNEAKLIDETGHFDESLEERFDDDNKTSTVAYLFERLVKHPKTDQLGLLRLEEYSERDTFNVWLEKQPSYSEDVLDDEYIDPNPLANAANKYAELLMHKQRPNEEEREMLAVDSILKALQKYYDRHSFKYVKTSNYIISGDLPDNYCHYEKEIDPTASFDTSMGGALIEHNKVVLATEAEAYAVIASLPPCTVLVRYRNSKLLPKLQAAGLNAVELIDIG
ncbi:hypothetical protein [Lentilactobacillus kefiri]|uniref:hypothetical protein n=1 Tax=Lentilactobacillus kefiri TaxID=33962 RepID=UPI001FBABE0E|nr:hypothetical protein [Lentilactobacillus kefiri]MCJ2162749.1 hypothetical protein [Lentilactobacillus kefiri]MCP9370149.1 hypothetical protein [Lentilactobacillus kefiri]